MDKLVKMLSNGEHELVIEKRTKSTEEIKERLTKLKFVFVTFTKTKGETELGLDIDEAETTFEQADLNGFTGRIKLVGTCELNYHKIRCTAYVDLKTRYGTGSIEVVV